MSLSALVNRLRDEAEELFHLERHEAAAAQHSAATLVEAELRKIKAQAINDVADAKTALSKLVAATEPADKAAAEIAVQAALSAILKDLA